MMKAKLLCVAAFCLVMLGQAVATTYTVDVDYDLSNGVLYPTSGGREEVESVDIPVNLPTLFTGDVINATINFTRGLALTLNDPGPGIQLFRVVFAPNNSASGVVSVSTQLSLLKDHGDLLTDS